MAGLRIRSCMAVCVLLGVAACSSAPAVPDGFTLFERDEFAIAAPAEWTLRVDDPEQVMAVGSEEVDGGVEAVDAKIGNFSGDFDAAVLGAVDPFRLTIDDYQSTEERNIDLPGADEGRFFDGTYQDGEGERTRQWDVFATASDTGRVIIVSLKAPESLFDEARMQQILDSFDVRL